MDGQGVAGGISGIAGTACPLQLFGPLVACNLGPIRLPPKPSVIQNHGAGHEAFRPTCAAAGSLRLGPAPASRPGREHGRSARWDPGISSRSLAAQDLPIHVTCSIPERLSDLAVDRVAFALLLLPPIGCGWSCWRSARYRQFSEVPLGVFRNE